MLSILKTLVIDRLRCAPRSRRREESSADWSQVVALMKSGAVADAEAAMTALTTASGSDEELAAVAECLLQQQQWHKALDFLRKVMEGKPDWAQAWYMAGWVSLKSQRHAEAEYYLSQALRLDEHAVAPLLALGKLCYDSGRLDEAREFFQRAVQVNGTEANAYFGLGNICKSRGEYEKAIEYFESGLRYAPGHVMALQNIGECYRNIGLLVPARRYNEQALKRDPQYVDALIDLSRIALYEGHIEQSCQYIDQALQIAPDSAAVRFNHAVLLLRRGEFDAAWKEYDRAMDLRRIRFRFPGQRTWNGEPLDGKTILVFGEQGIGDEILFAGCLPQVIEQAGQCVIECAPKLEELFRCSFPTAVVHGGVRGEGRQWLAACPKIDYETPSGSLPMFFRRRVEDFARQGGYLKAPDPRRRAMRERLSALGPGRKVGISWRGGTIVTGTFHRSVSLLDWAPILKTPGITFVSLQYTDCHAEIARVERELGVNIHHWQDVIDDYASTAALVSELDLTVSVCTSVITLAAALGRPVWVMVPPSAEWMNTHNGRSLWFPGARLFFQQDMLDWTGVIGEIAAELAGEMRECRQRC